LQGGIVDIKAESKKTLNTNICNEDYDVDDLFGNNDSSELVVEDEEYLYKFNAHA